MPYVAKRVGTHYEVINAHTGRVFARHTSAANAVRQIRLLHMKEAEKKKK